MKKNLIIIHFDKVEDKYDVEMTSYHKDGSNIVDVVMVLTIAIQNLVNGQEGKNKEAGK